jgi:hypothetical protein
VYESNYPMELVYQHHDGDPGSWVSVADKTDKNKTIPREGVDNGASLDPKAVYKVPEEFRDIAISRHVAAWGRAPEVVRIDDSTFEWDPFRAKQARDNLNKKMTIGSLSVQNAPVKRPVTEPLKPPPNPADVFKGKQP